MTVADAHEFARAARSEASRVGLLATEILENADADQIRPLADELVEVADQLARDARTVRQRIDNPHPRRSIA